MFQKLIGKLNSLKAKMDGMPGWKRGLALLTLVAVLLGTGGVLALAVNAFNQSNTIVSPVGNSSTKSSKSMVVSPNEPKDTPDPINGVLYAKSEVNNWKTRVPLAIMIENHVDARPQSGLSKAEVVYEALAEGGITRFMAIFLASSTEVGPVRSARAYYLDWLSEYGAGYAHWGGSPEAMDLIKRYSLKDLDQFFLGAPTYWRVADRAAPHNGYSSTDKLWEAAEKRGYNVLPSFDSWKFKNDSTDSAKTAGTINIDFGSADAYNVTWKYDPEKNIYLRENGKVAYKDKVNDEQFSAKNIVVESVKASSYDSYGRLSMETVGSGDAKIFRDGTVVEGTWKKPSREERTKFYDQAGQEIELNRGQIWIEVIPSSAGGLKGAKIEYSS
ncbi:MAG: DUF3048 domain-containing protein [Patescibacteria group bacterium]|nr:DUF3048 domain-containing protein [Patescibacteria group bacterium]